MEYIFRIKLLCVQCLLVIVLFPNNRAVLFGYRSIQLKSLIQFKELTWFCIIISVKIPVSSAERRRLRCWINNYHISVRYNYRQRQSLNTQFHVKESIKQCLKVEKFNCNFRRGLMQSNSTGSTFQMGCVKCESNRLLDSTIILFYQWPSTTKLTENWLNQTICSQIQSLFVLLLKRHLRIKCSVTKEITWVNFVSPSVVKWIMTLFLSLFSAIMRFIQSVYKFDWAVLPLVWSRLFKLMM